MKCRGLGVRIQQILFKEYKKYSIFCHFKMPKEASVAALQGSLFFSKWHQICSIKVLEQESKLIKQCCALAKLPCVFDQNVIKPKNKKGTLEQYLGNRTGLGIAYISL